MDADSADGPNRVDCSASGIGLSDHPFDVKISKRAGDGMMTFSKDEKQDAIFSACRAAKAGVAMVVPKSEQRPEAGSDAGRRAGRS